MGVYWVPIVENQFVKSFWVAVQDGISNESSLINKGISK